MNMDTCIKSMTLAEASAFRPVEIAIFGEEVSRSEYRTLKLPRMITAEGRDRRLIASMGFRR